MKIILTHDVDKLGAAGDVKDVKAGYVRNFLMPNGFAIVATPAAMGEWERTKEAREAKKKKAFEGAMEEAKKIDGAAISFSRTVGEGGKLFGSVAKHDIARGLAQSGFAVDKSQVELEAPLKEVGEFEVAVKLKPGVSAKVKVSVVPQS